jgi:hypothetical protein
MTLQTLLLVLLILKVLPIVGFVLMFLAGFSALMVIEYGKHLLHKIFYPIRQPFDGLEPRKGGFNERCTQARPPLPEGQSPRK